jgi:predicted phage terminase large subunit-like protein
MTDKANAAPPPALSGEELTQIVREDLTSFIECGFYELHPGHPLDLAPHIEVVATALEAVRRGEIKRLIINLPPRHLKSHCVSVAFVAWLLGHEPDKHIICASYGQDLADELAAACRRLMRSDCYRALFGTVLAGRQAVNDFETMGGGRRLATSVGGVLTGRGADIIVLDDPQKADEALSETSRKAVNTWYDNSLLSRLNDKARGCIIIVMQRLHQDDLVGHVLEQEDWVVVSLPAIAEVDERHLIDGPLGRRYFTRKAGDILHPQRESAESLANTRRAISEFSFASQYQQRPIPLGGAIVKTDWLRFYEPGEQPSKFQLVLQSWDTANKSGDLNDFSVGTTWGVIKQTYYLLDVSRKRLDFPDLKREVRRLAKLFLAKKILIEDKASGTQLIQDLKREGLHAVVPYAPPAGADKIMRLHAQTAVFENGRVLLPAKAPWLADYVNELTGFPGSRYADQVDSTTQALDYLHNIYYRDNWMLRVDWEAALAASSRPGPRTSRTPPVFI